MIPNPNLSATREITAKSAINQLFLPYVFSRYLVEICVFKNILNLQFQMAVYFNIPSFPSIHHKKKLFLNHHYSTIFPTQNHVCSLYLT